MKKRILSIILSIVMLVGLLPTTALAMITDVLYIGGVGMGDGTTATYYKNGDTETPTGTESDWNAKFEGNALWLNGLIVTASDVGETDAERTGIYSKMTELTINMTGDSSVTGASVTDKVSYGIYFDVVGASTLNITGSGSLTATGGNVTSTGTGGKTSRGIYMSSPTGRVIVESGTLNANGGTVTGSSSAVSDGILGALTVNGGTVNATGGTSSGKGHGIWTNAQDLTVTGGTVNAVAGTVGGTASYAVNTKNVYVSGGTLTATGGEATSGYSCGISTAANGTIAVSGSGKLEATGGKAKLESGGIFNQSTGTITVSDSGVLTALGGSVIYESDGSYSCGIYNGNVTVSGGTLTATGGDTGNAMVSCGLYETEVSVTGGTLIAQGGSNSRWGKAGYSCGIYSGKEWSVTGGTLTAIGGYSRNGDSYGCYYSASSAPATGFLNGGSYQGTKAAIRTKDSRVPVHKLLATGYGYYEDDTQLDPGTNKTSIGGTNAVIVKQTLPLTFTDSETYDIPDSTAGTAIDHINLSGAVSGGLLPYTFSAEGLPAGISISAKGIISGTPATADDGGTATITVTDNAGATASITIAYGAISEAPPHSHDMSVECGGSGVTYTAWDGTDAFPGGDVYLTDDVILTDTLTISSGTVNLCLNGNSITKESGKVIQVNTGATLNICDCKGSGSIMATGDRGRGIYLNSVTGTVNVYGGTVQATGDSGNGIYINNGTGTVSGGTVKATGTNGKGIYINSECEVAVSGGTIEATGNNGRGIDNSSGANATVTGGNVIATGSESYGVYNGYAGSFKLSGAPAISGTAADVYIDGEKIVTITGALTYIEENEISVEMNTPGTFTSGWTTNMGGNAENYGSYFTSANNGYTVQKNSGGELELVAPTTYTVTVTSEGNGTASASPTSGTTGTEITLTATPASGYHFKEWQVLSGGVTVSDNKFTIGTADVEIKAIFEADTPSTYTVTYTDNGVFLSNVTFEDVVYGAKAPTYSGTTNRPGYTFGGWYMDNALTTIWDFENDTVTGDITLYAKWTEKATVSIIETVQTYTWNNNPAVFTISGTPNTGFAVAYQVNDNWTTTAPSAVGTYDVKVTRAEDDTYKAYEKIITGGLVINAVVPNYAAPTAKTGLVYDGNVQDLINAGISDHSHWEYSLDGTSYSSDIPTGTDAKTYTVYCRFVPNTGYSEVNPVQLSVTIAPLAIDEPAVVGTYTYTGSEQTVTLDGVLDCMTVSGNKATHAGDYEVTIALDGNHKWNAESDGKIAWSIVAKTVTPTAALEYASIIYSGSERKPAVTLTDGDIEISVGEYTVVYSNNVNVGTAIVTITDKENGNYTFAEITKTFEIMKDGVSPVLSMDDYVYGGTPAVPNVSGNAGSGTVTVYYSTDSSRVDKLWEDISGTTLNVGTYYMKAHVAATDNYAEGISPVVTFKVTPGKYVAPSAPTASEFTVTVNEADRGKILEYSLDGTNWISVPVLTNGAFELKGLSESTRYTVYLRVKASSDGNYQASDAVSTVWTTPARYSVAYHANLGTGNVPASVTQNSGKSVTVARGSGLKRTGYTFAGWNTAADGTGTDYAPGSTISTGATLYAKWTANSYTVKFKANGGSGTMDDQNFTYDVTQALTGNAFTRDGYHFAGWALSSGNTAIYMDGQTVKNLSDKGTVTLHAVWVEDVYSIRAYFSSDSNHSINAKLMRGDAQIGSTQSVTMSGTDAPYTGHFDFTGVPKGIYNIVAEQDGKVITKLIIITDHDDTVEITMPASEVNSVLEVSEDAPPVVVGGLEDEAVTKAEESKTVTITMTVEKQEEQQLPDNASEFEKATQEAIAEIKEEASGKTFEFMDIEVEKTVEEAGQADVSEKLTETNKVMEIVISFDLTGKRDITVYRHHNGQTEQFAENTTKADGTFYIDETNHLIHVFSQKFSTYAIGYTEPASPAPDHPPVVSVHTCTSKCDVCGGCEDAACTESACKDKCRLLGMNFTDVAEGKWYTEPVEYVYHHKMMEGVGNNLFDINGTTTRAMIVTILWRLEGEPVVNYLMQFEDIPADTWYTEAVRWAASEKIVEGYSDTAFGPTDPITREQFATILWRYAKYKGYDVSVGEDTNILSYEDAFSISEYAIPAMQWACGAGLMQGDGVNLTPKADATRAQAAALFQRFCENVAEK